MHPSSAPSPSRRSFLQRSGLCFLGGVFGNMLAHPAAEQAPPLRIRKDVGTLAPDSAELKIHRKAITEMNKLKESDPRSWSFQANIHGSRSEKTDPAWNQCQHG